MNKKPLNELINSVGKLRTRQLNCYSETYLFCIEITRQRLKQKTAPCQENALNLIAAKFVRPLVETHTILCTTDHSRRSCCHYYFQYSPGTVSQRLNHRRPPWPSPPPPATAAAADAAAVFFFVVVVVVATNQRQMEQRGKDMMKMRRKTGRSSRRTSSSQFSSILLLNSQAFLPESGSLWLAWWYVLRTMYEIYICMYIVNVGG